MIPKTQRRPKVRTELVSDQYLRLSVYPSLARLVATLSVVQNKLAYLEAENSVSRRRVRALELELEACKKEVARERTRIMEHEHSMLRDDEVNAGKRRAASQRERLQQQKRKAEEDQAELAGAEARYRSAVEEKKGETALARVYSKWRVDI